MSTPVKIIKINAALTNLELAARNIETAINELPKNIVSDAELKQLREVRGLVGNAHYKLNRMK